MLVLSRLRPRLGRRSEANIVITGSVALLQYVGRKSRFLPQLRGHRRNIAIKFGTENLEWCGYPTVKIV